MQIIEGDKYYTIPEVAEIIGVHIQSVRRWIKQEKLKAVKVSRNFFINADDVKKMVSVGKPKYQRKPVKPIEPVNDNEKEYENLKNAVSDLLKSRGNTLDDDIFKMIYDGGFKAGHKTGYLELLENIENVVHIQLD